MTRYLSTKRATPTPVRGRPLARFHRFGVILAALCWIPASVSAITVAISPASVPSDFTGKISITITGLTTGKTVLLERFLDVNANGAVELPQDALTLSASVTDGIVPLLGGVRNANVPGDDDGATNGAIRIDLPFPNVDGPLGSVAGRSTFRITDPQSSFTPALASLLVTQKTQPQGVVGRLTSAASGAPLISAVVLLGLSDGSPFATTLSDGNGNYTFPTVVGSFTISVLKNGFVSDPLNGAVTVPANQFVTKNLALAAAAFAVTGRVTDSASSAGLAGVFVEADSLTNKSAGALTDASGNYTLQLTADQWQLGVSGGPLARSGYVRPAKTALTTAASGSATINFSIPKATAMIYGTAKDTAGNPVGGLQFEASDQLRQNKAEGISFYPNGNYSLGILSGSWSASPQSESLLAKGYTSSGSASFTLSNNQAKQANFVVQRVTAHLRGKVKDSGGAPIPNIMLVVQPVPLDPSGAGTLSPSTDANGNFDVGVRAGTWQIALECVAAQARGYVNVSGSRFNVVDGVDQNNLALTYPLSTATISGTVTDNQSNPIADVTVNASQQINSNSSYFPGCVTTDSKGNYTIRVLSGTWLVSVDSGDLTSRGFDSVVDQSVTISGGSATANFIARVTPPEILSPTTATVIAGQPFVYQFQTRFPAGLGVNNLPAGLTFDASLSAIVGTPTASGSFQVGLDAFNSGGFTSANLALAVQRPPTSGPVITSSTSATGRIGRLFSFQVTTAGGSPLTRVSANGLPSGLKIDPVSGTISGYPANAGSSAVTLSVTDGNLTFTSNLQLTFTSDLSVPVILSSGAVSVASGKSVSYAIYAPAAADPSDVTTYSLIGTLPSGLNFDPKTGTISGVYNGASEHGSSTDEKYLSGGVITNVQIFSTNSHGTSTIPLLFYRAPTGAVNISTRLAVGTGDNVLIGGFIITGNAAKKVVVRAIAPSLKVNGVPVPGTLVDPVLELYQGQTLLGSNDDWRSSQEQEVLDSTVPPTDEHEAAAVATLNPGGYTAIVRGKGSDIGIGLVEVYDLGTSALDTSTNSQLAQISTRGTVQSGDNVMIGGFIISGTVSKVIVRAIGPELTAFGVPNALQDTTLELRDGTGALVASNDDWRTNQQQQIIDSTVPPKDDRESAIVASLTPGPYTVIVRGKENSSGVALVEVYGLP